MANAHSGRQHFEIVELSDILSKTARWKNIGGAFWHKMTIYSADWWMERLSTLHIKFPAWQNCFKSISPFLLAGIAEKMSQLDVLAPAEEHFFRPFEMAPEDIRVVMLGKDPYPTPGMACGRAFAMANTNLRVPTSLRNLVKVLDATTDGTLDKWVAQGVFLLNSAPVLTTPDCVAVWHPFTAYVLEWLNLRYLTVTFVLMGRDAERFRKYVPELFGPVVIVPHPAERSGKFPQCQLREKIRDAMCAKGWNLEIDW